MSAPELSPEEQDIVARSDAAPTPPEVLRATLLRELCEQINLWDNGAVIEDEDGLAEHFLLPVIDRYVERLAAQPVQYLGYEVNGGQIELLLGDKFETHIVTDNEIKYRENGREYTVHLGDWVSVVDGTVQVWGSDPMDAEGPW